jgi:hypothetical protein
VSTPAASVPTQLVFTVGPLSTPESYVVPGSLEIQLSSVSATFDGTGAGGNFDPTVSIYSKDSKLISRTKVGSTVTAGQQAVCTWLPFSRKAATAGASTLDYCFSQYQIATTVHYNGGLQTKYLWPNGFQIGGTSFTDNGDSTFNINATGLYAITLDFQITAGVGGIRGMNVSMTGGSVFPSSFGQWDSDTTALTAAFTSSALNFLVSAATPKATTFVQNTSGGDITVDRASIFVVRLGANS